MNYTTKKIMINMTKDQLQSWIDQHKSEIDAYIASGGSMTDYIKTNFDVRSWKNLINVGGENERYLTTSYKELTELPTINGDVLIGDVTEIIFPAKPESMEVDTQYALCVSKDEDGNYTYNWINIEETVAELKTRIETETTRATEAEKTLQNNIDSKSEIEVSTQKVSGAADIYSINVDGTDYNFAGGSATEVDTEMSDTSTNAVQNKVIKTYADNIYTKLNEEISQTIANYQKADTQLQSNIDSEVSRAETAEQEISEALMTEQTERLDSEATLQSNIDKKQDAISDLSTIRSNAEKGATAVQPAALDNYYTKDETDSEIDTKISQSVGRYITSSTAGANFATKAVLTSGPYYYNGATVTLIATDYAIVAADEDHDNAQTRYIYSGSQWNYQYTISTTITAAQQAALDSGINTTKVAQITTNTTAISTETTERKEAVEACEKVANKTTSITTASTDTEYPSAKAVFTAIDEVYNDLQGEIEDEANTRSENDLSISTNLSKEVEARASADSSLQGEIEDEATARTNADSNLQTEIDNINQTTIPTLEESLEGQIANCEKTANKVTSLSSESTDTQYPSAKCVYDLVGNVETILQTLNTGTGAK